MIDIDTGSFRSDQRVVVALVGKYLSPRRPWHFQLTLSLAALTASGESLI
jgi:hypothetical protein